MFTLTLVVTLMSPANGNRLPHHYASSTRNSLWSAGSNNNNNNNHHSRQYQTQRHRTPSHADNRVTSERDHRWVDPCRAKPLPSTFQGDQSFDPHMDKKNIFETIIMASHIARHSGEKAKKKFVSFLAARGAGDSHHLLFSLATCLMQCTLLSSALLSLVRTGDSLIH